ncbi:MAG: hypothetical protein ACKOJE_07435 [Bacteroidota bacterium]
MPKTSCGGPIKPHKPEGAMADFSPDKEGLSPGTYPLLDRSGLKTNTA